MVFVTGGTGFLGAYILKELVEKGYQVRAIRRTEGVPSFIPASVGLAVEWIPGNILDTVGLTEVMEGSHAVIHAAAKVSLLSRERTSMFKTNIEGTMNVVNTAVALGIPHFLHVSSVAALGRSDRERSIDEGHPWDTVELHSNYAKSKYHAEMEVWRAIAEGLPAAIINPSTILGYGDWNKGSCAIFKSVYEEFPWYTEGINGFVNVEDVARAAVMLMERKISGERFVVSADNWSFRQLFNSIADGFNKKHPGRMATPLLSEIAWRMEKMKAAFSGSTPLLTRESAKIARSRTHFSNQKIQRFLPGYGFTPLEQTIREACNNYLSLALRPELAK